MSDCDHVRHAKAKAICCLTAKRRLIALAAVKALTRGMRLNVHAVRVRGVSEPMSKEVAIDCRNALIEMLLEKLDEATRHKGAVRKLHIKGIHSFFATQYEALKRDEAETGEG